MKDFWKMKIQIIHKIASDNNGFEELLIVNDGDEVNTCQKNGWTL